MQTFNFFFDLLWEELCFVTLILNRTLQKKDFSAAEGQVIAGKTVVTLQSIRNEEASTISGKWLIH